MKEREAIVEGIFYPQEREELSNTVKGLITSSNVQSSSDAVFGLIVPHAGYNYCGRYTGSAFAALPLKDIKTVLLIGPVHRDPEAGVFLSESDKFTTPLGPVAVNQAINEELLSSSTAIIRNDIPHLEEHCLEVQLPFIQTLYPEVDIVPILMGIPSAATVRALTGALDLILPERIDTTLIILSANASTFVEKSKADESARLFKTCIEDRDPETLMQGIKDGTINSCGAGCAAAVLGLNSLSLKGTLVSEGSSHASDGPDKHTVHYASFKLNSGENNG